MKYFLLLLSLVLSPIFALNLYAEDVRDLLIYNSDKELIAYIKDNKLHSSENKILYNAVGKIIFTGDNDRRRNMKWMVQIPNFTGSRSGKLTRPNSSGADYTTHRSGFFYGDRIMEFNANLMLRLIQEEDSLWFKKGLSEEKIGFGISSAEEIPVTHLVMAFQFIKDYEVLDAFVKGQIAEWKPEAKSSMGSGTIRPLWEGARDEFIWDGQVLKKRWSAGDQEWTFDGTILRNTWTGSEDEYEWDGNVLKKRWGMSGEEYEWDGRTMRRRFDSRYQYSKSGNVIRRDFTSADRDEWEIQGDIPIPVIMLVIFRIAK